MKHLIVLTLALTMSGCATSVQMTKFKEIECASPGPSPELLFKGENSSKPFEKLALLTADNERNSSISESEMFEELKKQGSAICADALLVQDIGNSDSVYTFGSTVASDRITVIRAIAVRYK